MHQILISIVWYVKSSKDVKYCTIVWRMSESGVAFLCPMYTYWWPKPMGKYFLQLRYMAGSVYLKVKIYDDT